MVEETIGLVAKKDGKRCIGVKKSFRRKGRKKRARGERGKILKFD